MTTSPLSREVRRSKHAYQRQALTLEFAGNSGIGYETTLQLALHGARVYIAGRSPDRMKKAMEQMKASSAKQLDLHMLEMDLQSLVSVKEGAEAFMKQESRLDLLINNAGVRTLRQPLKDHGKCNLLKVIS